MANPADSPAEPRGHLGSGDSCVEYMLFLLDSSDCSRKSYLSKLEEVRKAAVELVQRLTSDYIWQRDEFSLTLRHDHQLTYLHGVVDYGDSVEDEWLVVYLLRELTLSRPDLWVRVFDGDGEFLLIEAANNVPPWINPEMDTNRPWIHQGKLHVIAPNPGQETSSTGLSLQDAVDSIQSRKDSLFHSDKIDSEAFYRLEKYPGHIQKSLHHALITIPRKLACILHTRPKSISPAVEAFYLRDAKSLKPIVSETSALAFPPTDLVTVCVTFTRVLYAQVRSQRFDPPARWAPVINQAGEGKEWSRIELGMKLTCGFEMMVGKLDTYDSRVVREVGIILEDLEEDGDGETLPSDDDIRKWAATTTEDDDSWLDINFEDFERELEGRGPRQTEPGTKGFGDVKTQADLRKLVSRFDSFLNDETAGADGAEVDPMDRDDDEKASDSESSDDEETAVSFDEEAFGRLMRGVMGVPTSTASPGAFTKPARAAEGESVPPDRDPLMSKDTMGLSELAAQLEDELREHGALKLDNVSATKASIKDKGKGVAVDSADDSDSGSEDGEMDINYNLAKNILESFKSQAGMAGPAGNLMGMMGMQLPRDEDDSGDASEPTKK